MSHLLPALVIPTSTTTWTISSEHFNYAKHPMVRSLYRFHVYYHVRRVLKGLQVLLPHEADFKLSDNPYINEEFFKICEDYNVSHDPMKYRDEKLYWTYQRGVSWLDDHINPDSMTKSKIAGSSKNLRALLMWDCLEFQKA